MWRRRRCGAPDGLDTGPVSCASAPHGWRQGARAGGGAGCCGGPHYRLAPCHALLSHVPIPSGERSTRWFTTMSRQRGCTSARRMEPGVCGAAARRCPSILESSGFICLSCILDASGADGRPRWARLGDPVGWSLHSGLEALWSAIQATGKAARCSCHPACFVVLALVSRLTASGALRHRFYRDRPGHASHSALLSPRTAGSRL